MGSLDLNGPVLITKVLCGTNTVAEDVKISLPEVTFLTAEFNALGKMELPIALTEALEGTITRIGIDNGLFKMLKLKNQQFEYRWGQSTVTRSGETKNKGCKAFVKGTAKSIPGGDLEPGETFEGSIPIAITRYQLYVDGKECILIDKLKGILRIDGVDYAKELNSLV